MKRVLVSACLLGEKVRYHGGAATLEHPVLERWRAEGRIVPVCPEIAGGMPTPRPPAEIAGGTGHDVLRRAIPVRRRDGADVTEHFLAGAEAAVALARAHAIDIAVLKDLSPSCGSAGIYDGTFSGGRVEGEGVAAAALRLAGVRVFGERDLELADALLRQ